MDVVAPLVEVQFAGVRKFQHERRIAGDFAAVPFSSLVDLVSAPHLLGHESSSILGMPSCPQMADDFAGLELGPWSVGLRRIATAMKLRSRLKFML